jgi:hypothetical protein
MRPRILLTILLTALFVLVSGCGGVKNCPVCGTTLADGYTSIVTIPVPEHNPTGEPGGPFNSFDISVVDPVNHRFFVSDRIGLDVVVVDTQQDVAVNLFAGANGVAGGGINASPCSVFPVAPAVPTQFIPPIVSGLGNWTRFGCRTLNFHIPGFGANGLFGGFPGAQCCAARANGVNPLSGPDGETLSPDNKTLFVGNGSSSVAAFDLTTTTYTVGAGLPPGPTMIAEFPTGVSPDYDGPSGIAPCVASANGRAFSDLTCGDLRADEMSIGVVNGTTILFVANGDPGFPFYTLVDVTNIVSPAGTAASFPADHCLPVAAATPYGPPLVGTGQGNLAPAAGPINPPTCVLGQIYYDGAVQNDSTVVIDDGGLNATTGFPCPDPSTTALSGVTGHGGGVNILGPDRPCHHGPMLNPDGTFCASQGTTAVPPSAGCVGAVAIAGLGGSAFNPNTGRFLASNSNASGTNLTIGSIDVINPNLGSPNGPFVENSFPMPNCMPTSIVQGPGNNFLVGCGDHDGQAFPPNEYVIDGTSGAILATITNVGGVDEIWYNSGDNRYYLAARDMPSGPVMGVIDAKTNQWLVNVATGSNSHSISVDPSNNHVFVPLQAGALCTTQSANGCVAVYAQQ